MFPSFSELLVILFVIVLIFGAPRLPQIGDALGRAIRNFKNSVRGDNEIDVSPTKKLPPSEDKPRDA